MRQGPSNRRARGRGNSGGRRTSLPNRNQTFDSNGPDVRIRGTAFQVNEKYQALARDASASGDRIMAENYLQHAEHYHRIIAAINEAHTQSQQPQPDGREAGARSRGDGDGRDGGHRDNGHRDGGHRDGGHRDNGHRDGGQQAKRESKSGDGFPETVPEADFGKDPRQDDPRDAPAEMANGEAVIDSVAGRPAKDAKPAKAAAANGADDGDGSEEPAKPVRRRGPGRPRKTAAKESAPAPEADAD